MQTQGEAENLMCRGVSQIMQGILGHGPQTIKCHIFDDTVMVRMSNRFNAMEHRLANSKSSIIKDYRESLIESVRDSFDNMILSIFDVPLLSIHHDILLPGGEEVFLFTLAGIPSFRLNIRNGKSA
jgi:uncharacterized protein YbcI